MEPSISPHDTGLAAMVAAAQPGDHGVVADWIEEHLRLDDLAAILRAGLDDPRSPGEQRRTRCDEFRYRQIDRLVLLAVGAGARGPVLGVGVERMADALRLAAWEVETVEGDVYLRG